MTFLMIMIVVMACVALTYAVKHIGLALIAKDARQEAREYRRLLHDHPHI